MGHCMPRIADGPAPRRRTVVAGAALAGGLALTTPPSAAAPHRRTAPPQPRAASGLADLILDQIGRLDPAFDPDITEYTATAYRSLETVTVRPITTGDGVTVTVDGSAPDPEAHDRVAVDLELGENILDITVENGDRTSVYTVTITKVDTDFRGRELVTGLTATSPVGEAEGRPLTAMFDGDEKTSWHPAEPLTAGEPDEDGVTTFTVHLPEVRTVGRVAGHVLTPEGQWYPSEWESYLSIDVSEDGDTWERAAHHATLRQDQDILYWELGDYYAARHVRITLAGKDDRLHEEFGVQEIQVFALPVGAEPPPRHEPPADGGQEFAYVPTEESVNRAQELVLAHGLVIAQWATSDGYAAGSLDAREFEDFAEPTAQFYDPDFGNRDFMACSPTATWGIAKAPAGGNGIQDAGEPHEYIPEAMEAYRSRFIDAQYGDEGPYSSEEVEAFARWFEFSRETYPQAITHSNQNNDPTWAELENFRHYVRTARPDLVSFDHYYWGGGDVFGSHGPAAWDATNHLLGLAAWRTQRQVALEGLTGDGSEPILFGQYLDAFDHNGSQSQKALVTSLSLASGMKWLSLFRMEINRYDGNSYFDLDGAPTRAYWETCDILHRARKLGTYLAPLTNDWVAVQPGSHLEDGKTITNTVPRGYRTDSIEESLPTLSEYGISRIEVTNTGTVNDGLPGDVAIGFFTPLPGLTGAQAEEVFGAEDPRAFMVVNGLIGTAELPSTKKLVRYDEGQYWQTEQQVRLVLAPPQGAELMRVDQTTGEAEAVEITRTPVGENGTDHELEHSITARIGGGRSELYYWTAPALTVQAAEDPTVIEVGSRGTAAVTLTNTSGSRTKPITIDPTVPEGWALHGSWPQRIGALTPGESVTVDLELQNQGLSGDAVIDLGLRFHNVRSSAAIRVRGECAGTRIVPTPIAADSEETVAEDGAMGNVADEDPSTFWHTQWHSSSPGYPHWIVLDLGSEQDICSLVCLPRQDAAVGQVKDYAVYVSDDPESFPQEPAAAGTLASGQEEKAIGVQVRGRYLRFEGSSAWDGKPFMVVASLTVHVS